MNRLLKKPLVSGKRLGFHPSLSRSIFIQTETTPNPHSMKFIPGDEVLPERFGTGMYFQKTDIRDLQKSPLAKLLFTIDGVKSIFFARDVITITKDTDVVWTVLKPQLFSKILDFYGDANPQVMIDSAQMGVSDTAILDDDDEVVAMIKELIETRVRPAVQDDGGDIYYEGFDADRGIVKVRLAGSCVGCPSSSITLKNGVEQMLRHYIAEVEGVEEVGAVDEDGELIPDTEMKLSHTPIN
jgi:NFU1 iron-sulfur cluster scaffold homolog, mitochondrial